MPYRTIITTYHEDDSAWQPFKVEVERDQGRGDRRQVFFAEQCEDVSVAQTRKLLYVFYDQMYLNRLRAKSSYLDEPKPFLCDIGIPFCLAERERLRRSGTKIIKVCPSRNEDGTPGP